MSTNISINSSPLIRTVVSLNPIQIKSLGTPFTLLNSPGANKYYDIQKIIIEYTFGTVAYAIPTSLTLYLDGAFDSYIDKTLLTSATNSVCTISGNLRNTLTVGSGSGSVQVKTNKDVLDAALILGTPNGDNPTTGDGTVRIIIYYEVKTFGS